jgi:RHS repeat-associated protein
MAAVVGAGVVHALLQARYYDGSKGGFLSEDPVFLGNPADQDLMNPQSLNSYSYANDNPITKSDPNGRDAYTVGFNLGSELGIGAFGGGTINVGVSYVRNPDTGQSWIAFPFSYGSVLGTPSGALEIPQRGQKPPFVIGAYAGAGPSGSKSPNAKRPEDLYGTEDSANYAGPFISGSVSGGGTGNPTYTVSPGVKGLASVSQYAVTTVPYLPAFSINRAQSAAAGGAARVSAAVQQLQTQFATLVAQFNAYVASRKQ